MRAMQLLGKGSGRWVGDGSTLSRTPRSVGFGIAVTTTKSAAVVAARAAARRVNFMFARGGRLIGRVSGVGREGG